jgi:MFS family permease
VNRDARLLVAAQALRAAGYGFTAVVLGALLAARGYGHARAGVLLAALVGGTALSSLAVGAVADRIGRRRCYAVFSLGIACAGAAVASGAPYWLLFAVALTGTLSTDVVDNGPATTLEQVMLAAHDDGSASIYGWYNFAASTCGALGSLAVALPFLGTRRGHVPAALFLALVPIGVTAALLATRLSPDVEAAGSLPAPGHVLRRGHGPSRAVIRRLAALFAVDAGAGGLVTAGFLAYYLSERYDVAVGTLGRLFFATSAVTAVSMLVAPRLARRYGLVATMVGTHLPSNVLLASVAFAPSFPVAVALLLGRTALSQMDVPTRQALVMTVVTPAERTTAAAVTNAARYTVRPFGPLVAGGVQQIAAGAPLVVAGAVKIGYDLALWHWARNMPRGQPGEPAAPEGGATQY